VKRLTIIDTTVIKTGTSDSGKPWTLWEVTAVNEDGAPIEAKLKSFDKLEGTVEVDVERQSHEKYGVSYMLKLPGGAPGSSPPPSGARLGPNVDALRDRVDALETRVADLAGVVTTLVERSNEAAGLTARPPLPTPVTTTPTAATF
jgi:hypothetical protein